MTEGCKFKVRSRGVCTKCYGTLRVLVRKGRYTWAQLVEKGLCLPAAGKEASPIMKALAGAGLEPELDPGNVRVDEDDCGLTPDEIDDLATGVDSDQGETPQHATTHPIQALDPDSGLADEFDDEEDDETPQQKAKRKRIQDKHRKQQLAEIEANGIPNPTPVPVAGPAGGPDWNMGEIQQEILQEGRHHQHKPEFLDGAPGKEAGMTPATSGADNAPAAPWATPGAVDQPKVTQHTPLIIPGQTPGQNVRIDGATIEPQGDAPWKS
jgi:hypothetical protein